MNFNNPWTKPEAVVFVKKYKQKRLCVDRCPGEQSTSTDVCPPDTEQTTGSETQSAGETTQSESNQG